jgi:hypothetical protein
VQFYAGGQERNQAANPTKTRAALLPFTILSAMTLIVGEALVVATAASVATITNAKAVVTNIMSIIAVS